MKIRLSAGERLFNAFNYGLLTLIMLLCLYPMYYVAVSSISSNTELMRHTGLMLVPQGFSLEAYRRVFVNPNILSGYRNTLFVLVVGLVVHIVMTSLCAYFFSRKNVLWKRPLMFLVTFTMFFSGGIIPFFLVVTKDLKMLNSLWSLILPFAINTYNMIIMRTSFQAIPDSLEESAMLDGAGHLRILFSIILPLSKAIVAVMILYYGVGIWNGWFWASAFIRKREMLPLQVILREILLNNDVSSMSQGGAYMDQEGIGKTIKYATIMIATLPVLALYPALQRYFAKGVMVGAVKG